MNENDSKRLVARNRRLYAILSHCKGVSNISNLDGNEGIMFIYGGCPVIFEFGNTPMKQIVKIQLSSEIDRNLFREFLMEIDSKNTILAIPMFEPDCAIEFIEEEKYSSFIKKMSEMF